MRPAGTGHHALELKVDVLQVDLTVGDAILAAVTAGSSDFIGEAS